jgi:methyltransferase (TIGR00027 family)
MRKNQTSLTALGIAVLRAVESEKAEGERICYDPYARFFVPGWFYAMMRFFIRSGYAEWRGRGVIGFLAARERYIDDSLARWIEEGFDQLVILGAGYDSRAYRLSGLSRPRRVFEVDHPLTQAAKLAGVRKIFGRLPEHVRYVAIDFNQQSLGNCLAEHGYDPQAKTVFVWQGVTYYLDAEAVFSTLTFIADHAGAGSRVTFDFIDERLLWKATGHNEVINMHRYRGVSGEEMRFGFPISEIETFMERRGFQQVEIIRSEELKDIYFGGKNLARKVMAGYAIVSAVVGA